MPDERSRLIEAGREVYERGLVAGTWGNMSRRLQRDPTKFLMTPSGRDYREIEPSDLVTLNLEGEKVDGAREPSTESPLHSLIYESREDVNAIIHTHSESASAMACLRKEIPPILEDMVQIAGGGIETADYETPGTRGLARSALDALGDKNAALLANHGAVALGRDLEEGLKVAEIVEKSARIYLMTRILGEPERLSDSEVKELRDMYETYRDT